ncbi:prolipoprotein diacylglyceryl transferase [Pedobacter sandarakinus]|uniref:prolipoprotein diacylglyceryl transferase n=1 Tax=Pedobacter sandarakinus TaxID=353156 RepID=UPI002245A583|nr:prolipoprotein diacylglyceryl transferase family protein [Pedobacter sandarakinus]MCX2574128.1 prolipoprotein diacylglyceryl transferase [Pedobacter sandarakinus]
MFPTLSDLTKYLFNVAFPLPVQTFGLFVSLAFVGSYFVFKAEFKRKEKQGYIKPIIRNGELVHPYQLVDELILWCAFFGFIGAKLFSFVEDYDRFIRHPWEQLTSVSGLTFYGGLVFGAAIYLFIGKRYGMKLIHLADIGSPGMLVAYGIGRIGCQLSGDGDWGLVNSVSKPTALSWLPDWMWAYDFPHNAANKGNMIKDCLGEHCMVLPYPVYPTSFYEVVIITLLFLVLFLYRKKMKPGIMFSLYLILGGLERFLIEFIRINPKMHVFGIALSEAQIVSAIMIMLGLVIFITVLFGRAKNKNIQHHTN